MNYFYKYGQYIVFEKLGFINPATKSLLGHIGTGAALGGLGGAYSGKDYSARRILGGAIGGGLLGAGVRQFKQALPAMEKSISKKIVTPQQVIIPPRKISTKIPTVINKGTAPTLRAIKPTNTAMMDIGTASTIPAIIPTPQYYTALHEAGLNLDDILRAYR